MTVIRLTCPKHRRWNAALHGEGAIRGACPICLQIWRVYLEGLKIHAANR